MNEDFGQIKDKLPFAFEKESADFQREHVLLVIKELDAKRTKHIPPQNLLIFEHGQGWNFQQQGRAGYSSQRGEMKLKSSQVTIHLDRILANDLTLVHEFIENVSSSFEQGFVDELIKSMSSSVEQTGNVVMIGKDGIDPQDFLNLIKNIDLLVDDDGKVSRPSLFLPPDMTEKVMLDLDGFGPEYKQRVEALWAQKEKEALENEATRLAQYER